MARAGGLLRALQRLPGAGFEATSALRAAATSTGGSLQLAGSKDAGPTSAPGFGGFNAQLRSPLPFSWAAQMHTLTRKEEEQAPATTAAAQQLPSLLVPQAPKALAALPPKPKSALAASAAARRMMGSGAGEAHLEPNEAHPFHILPPSPWPFVASMSSGTMMLGMAGWFHSIPTMGAVMFSGLASLLLTGVAWWRDCIIESDMGMHTEVQKQNIINGIWIFIVSEAALFFGLLWSCVHLGMSPSVALQMQWPPVGIEPIGWEGRAMVMSAVLAASYYSANVAVVANDPKVVIASLATTIGLGALFLADQYLEYSTAPFTITDGPYGTTFFMTTGFHGFHVLVGSIWLAAALASYPSYKARTLTLQGAVLYWHFVDLVWIAVYGIIYAASL